jgi:hypothetical protein
LFPLAFSLFDELVHSGEVDHLSRAMGTAGDVHYLD